MTAIASVAFSGFAYMHGLGWVAYRLFTFARYHDLLALVLLVVSVGIVLRSSTRRYRR